MTFVEMKEHILAVKPDESGTGSPSIEVVEGKASTKSLREYIALEQKRSQRIYKIPGLPRTRAMASYAELMLALRQDRLFSRNKTWAEEVDDTATRALHDKIWDIEQSRQTIYAKDLDCKSQAGMSAGYPRHGEQTQSIELTVSIPT